MSSAIVVFTAPASLVPSMTAMVNRGNTGAAGSVLPELVRRGDARDAPKHVLCATNIATAVAVARSRDRCARRRARTVVGVDVQPDNPVAFHINAK